MNLLLKNAKIFGHPQASQLWISDGEIKAIAAQAETISAAQEINCDGAWLLPCLADRQVFANDGFEDLDRSACAGGVREALIMPSAFKASASKLSHPTKAHLIMASPITYWEGDEEKLAEIGLAYQAGARFFCNGLSPIADSGLMRHAMSYIADLDATLIHQPQDPALALGGMMNEGIISARLGLKGIPHQAETIMLARDIELAQLTHCRTHIAQISTAKAVHMIRRAKEEGAPISCGASINHLLLNETAIGDFRTFCKLTPPLRTETDRQALIEGVTQGVIDSIISSHNPQSQETKRLPFELAEHGSIGLETFLPALFALHHETHIPLEALMRAATVFQIAEGEAANLVCYDPDSAWRLDVAQTPLKSKAQNAALDGKDFYGKILMSIFAGEIVFDARSN